MRKISGNEVLVEKMRELGITAEELEKRMFGKASLSLIQSWMCGRREIRKSSAEIVFTVAEAIYSVARDKMSYEEAEDLYRPPYVASWLTWGLVRVGEEDRCE